MNKSLLISVFLLFSTFCFSQKIDAQDLIEKSIKAHDPNSKFEKLKYTFEYQIVRDGAPTRNFEVAFNRPKDIFVYSVKSDSVSFQQKLEKGVCDLTLNGSKLIPEIFAKKYQIDCERTKYLKSVYTYLFGLPFKLKDPGVMISNEIKEVDFNQKNCYEVTVSFEEGIGTDRWFFYFDQSTYLLNGYKFIHDSAKNDGEFIFLENYHSYNGILYPRIKKWHWNQTEQHFRTDKIMN